MSSVVDASPITQTLGAIVKGESVQTLYKNLTKSAQRIHPRWLDTLFLTAMGENVPFPLNTPLQVHFSYFPFGEGKDEDRLRLCDVFEMYREDKLTPAPFHLLLGLYLCGSLDQFIRAGKLQGFPRLLLCLGTKVELPLRGDYYPLFSKVRMTGLDFVSREKVRRMRWYASLECPQDEVAPDEPEDLRGYTLVSFQAE